MRVQAVAPLDTAAVFVESGATDICKMPKEDADLAGSCAANAPAIKDNSEVPPPAESAIKETDASGTASAPGSVSVSASASSDSATPPPANEEAEDEAELLERMRGDAVGDTMFSRKFILQTIMKLVQLQPDSPWSRSWRTTCARCGTCLWRQRWSHFSWRTTPLIP